MKVTLKKIIEICEKKNDNDEEYVKTNVYKVIYKIKYIVFNLESHEINLSPKTVFTISLQGKYVLIF